MAETLTQTVETESLSLGNGDTVTLQGSMGPAGPAGPPGPAGADGTGAMSPWQEEVFDLSGDQTVFTLAQAPLNGWVFFYVNGLRQTSDNFTVVGLVVTVTGFVPTSGDTIAIAYQ